MDRIAVRELRLRPHRYLARVRGGETIEVIDGGQLIALLTPPDPEINARERLIDTGRLVPASRTLRLPRRVPARRKEDDSIVVLADLRSSGQ